MSIENNENAHREDENLLTEAKNNTEEPTQSSSNHYQKSSSNSAGQSKFIKGLLDFVQDIEGLGDKYLVEQAPFTLPNDVKQFIAKIFPYVVILSLLASLPVLFALLGVGILSFVMPLAGVFLFFAMIFTAGAFIFQVLALKPLFAMSRKGWTYTFYAGLLMFVAALLNKSLGGALIGGIIGFYILFQIKSSYNK